MGDVGFDGASLLRGYRLSARDVSDIGSLYCQPESGDGVDRPHLRPRREARGGDGDVPTVISRLSAGRDGLTPIPRLATVIADASPVEALFPRGRVMAWTIRQVPHAKLLRGSHPPLKDVYCSAHSSSSWPRPARLNQPDLQMTMGAEPGAVARRSRRIASRQDAAPTAWRACQEEHSPLPLRVLGNGEERALAVVDRRADRRIGLEPAGAETRPAEHPGGDCTAQAY